MAYLDTAGLTRVWQKIKSLLDGKVDKIDGMGLSQESFTSDNKSSLDSVQEATDLWCHFGNICTSQGALVVGSEDKLHIIDAKIIDPVAVDEKNNLVILYLTEQIQDALTKANSYTDEKTLKSVATPDQPGIMSAADKRHLDEIWEAWSTKRFLTVAKE